MLQKTYLANVRRLLSHERLSPPLLHVDQTSPLFCLSFNFPLHDFKINQNPTLTEQIV